MSIPAWILDIFAAIMLLVAAVSATRLVVSRAWRGGDTDADLDIAHLLMGISMAGMLVASLTTLPSVAWEVIFGVLTAWFGWRVYREARAGGARVLVDGCHSPHLVHSGAMLYMFLALAGPAAAGSGPGMSGMGGASGMQTLRLPTLAFLFALVLAGYAVRDLDLVSGALSGRPFALPGAGIAPAAAVLVAGSAGAGLPPAGAAPAPSGDGGGTVTERAAAEPSATAGRHDDAAAPRNLVLAPDLATACRIAMGVTMAFMLAIMI